MSPINNISDGWAAVSHIRTLLVSLVAVFCLSVSLLFFVMSTGKPYMGAMLSLGEQGWVVRTVDANGAAIRAGIRAGDKPVDINGQPAEDFLDKYREDGVVFGTLINRLTVADNHGQLKSVSLRESSASWESIIELLSWFVLSFVFWVTGFYVFLKRPQNLAALLLFLVGLDIGLVFSGDMAAVRAVPTAVFFEVGASIIGPWLMLHFFLVLPEERIQLRQNRLIYLIYVPAIVTLILFPIIGYADGQPILWFRSFRLFEYGVGFLASVGTAILNYLGTSSARTKQQMKIMLISVLAALIPFIFLNILPEAMWNRTLLPTGFSILLIAFIPLGMGYAVVTRKLMDIDVVIRRGAVYGLVTIVMATILSIAIFPIILFHESIGIPEEILLALGLGGIASFLFGPTKTQIERLIDHLFYKDRYDYRQIIQEFSTSLNAMKDFSDVSRLTVGTAVRALNLAGGCLFVKAPSGFYEVSTAQGTLAEFAKQERLQILIGQRDAAVEFPNSASALDADVAFLIPLIVGEKKVGFLYLAPKITRQDFSSDDMYLLQGLAAVAAAALHRAMLIRDVSIRDTFVSIASHELRTPLTSIVGYADLLLQRDPPAPTRKQWVKNILDNGQKITAMVDELLNVSRIQSGRVTFKLEPVKLADVLQERLSVTRESTNKHEFSVEVAPDLPDVFVDRDKFGQVIGNLMSNAVKYSPGGGHITLSARHDAVRSRVVVAVTDEGMGIGPADKGSLFTTFHRIQRPEMQGIRGSGLGLYIAKEWTEAMGGEIWLESELNKGSTFFVAVPTQSNGQSAPK